MRKFKLTYSESDFPMVLNRVVNVLVHGYADACRNKVTKRDWQKAIEGARKEHLAKPWVDRLTDRLRNDGLKKALDLSDHFRKEKSVDIILTHGMGYILLRPWVKNSDVSMSLADVQPDFWFYKLVFQPILDELERLGFGHYEEEVKVETATPIIKQTATTLSQEAIDYLRRTNDCYF